MRAVYLDTKTERHQRKDREIWCLSMPWKTLNYIGGYSTLLAAKRYVISTYRKYVPSKFLNVNGFGMKMYTSKPITAQLFLQEGL